MGLLFCYLLVFEDQEEGQIAGSDVFQFKTVKKSGSMAQKGRRNTAICKKQKNKQTKFNLDLNSKNYIQLV